jgi:hypothetical protein
MSDVAAPIRIAAPKTHPTAMNIVRVLIVRIVRANRAAYFAAGDFFVRFGALIRIDVLLCDLVTVGLQSK